MTKGGMEKPHRVVVQRDAKLGVGASEATRARA